MSDRDEFHVDEVRDAADDLLLGELDRAELLGLNTPTTTPTVDPWEPNPRDLEPWEPTYIRFGRKGQ